MQLDQQTVAVVSIALVYIILTIILAYKLRNSKSKRVKLLWKFVVLNSTLFSVGMVALVFFLPESILNILSWIIYDLIISYVVAVEIPGYLRLLEFDETSIRNLEDLRKCLVKMRYSFESLENFKTIVKTNASILSEEQVDDLLNDFVNLCERLKNLDVNLWALILNEITEAMSRISRRSKHPIPKLVDVLSLTGISFLLAQILKMLG